MAMLTNSGKQENRLELVAHSFNETLEKKGCVGGKRYTRKEGARSVRRRNSVAFDGRINASLSGFPGERGGKEKKTREEGARGRRRAARATAER